MARIRLLRWVESGGSSGTLAGALGVEEALEERVSLLWKERAEWQVLQAKEVDARGIRIVVDGRVL